MKCLSFFVLTFGIAAAFIVPSEIYKRLTYRDSAFIIDRIVVEPEEIKSTHVVKIKDRSVNNDNIKDIQNSLNDIVIQDETPKPSNVDERSFVYLKQKHRTPIINVVHGSPDMLGKSNAQPIANLNKAYLRDVTQKHAQRYIDNFLKGYTFLKPSWLLSEKNREYVTPKNVSENNSVPKLLVNPGNDHQNEKDRDSDIDEKIKFVEFLKPPPLVRCEQRKGKHEDYIRDLQHTTPPISVGRFNNGIYPLIPTRTHNNDAHYSPKQNYGNICDHKHPLKESLCTHIYNSHIEDCVRRLLGKNDENAVRFLSKCIRDI